MSKTKRKRYSGAFKAKVGLEALLGVKTVGQIARDYQVHPVQVTQWKGVIRDRLPKHFETPTPETEGNMALISELHEKIGELTVDTLGLCVPLWRLIKDAEDLKRDGKTAENK